VQLASSVSYCVCSYLCGMFKGWGWVLIICMMCGSGLTEVVWVIQIHFIGGSYWGPSMVVCSFVCGCCERTFNRLGDLTQHKIYCDGQPPPLKQSRFQCKCGRIFWRKGDLTRHQHYCSSWGCVIGPVLHIQDPAIVSRQALRYVCVCVCVCVCACVCKCVCVSVRV